MNDQPMCQRPDIYCGKCDTCKPTNMTREQRIQEVLEKITNFNGSNDYGFRELSYDKLAAFLVDEVLGKPPISDGE